MLPSSDRDIIAGLTLGELVDWVKDAMRRIEVGPFNRARVDYLRRIHVALVRGGWSRSGQAITWHQFARRCARLLGEAPPPEPVIAVAEWDEDFDKLPARMDSRAKRKQSQKRKARKKRRPSRREPKYQISAEFQFALDAVKNGQPLTFVTGRAGTGKSTFIHILRGELSEKNLAVLAPTGIAALNAGGQTIHSFFKFPLKPIEPSDISKSDDPTVFEKLDVLVIDEVSMVRADILDAVDVALRLNRKSTLPFGGVQMVLVGDLFQLPPVVVPGEAAWFAGHQYSSVHFFGAKCLAGLAMTSIELTHVYRQDDKAFVGLLGSIREGRDVARAAAELNRQCVGPAPKDDHLMLVPRNDAAERANAAAMERLPGKLKTFTGILEGKFPQDRLPAPRELSLKVGAQVMFTRNDGERRWVNGSTGRVEKFSLQTIGVRLTNGTFYDVEPEVWENNVYAFDREEDRIVAEVIGSYKQFPLMPAWAVTIHKAQGLTLPRVHVDFGAGAFAEGQAYVALSRCRSMKDLTLARPLRARDVKFSESIAQFYRSLRPELPGQVTKTLTIAAWNVRGAVNGRSAEIVAALVSRNIDVAVIGEFASGFSWLIRYTRSVACISLAGFHHLP